LSFVYRIADIAVIGKSFTVPEVRTRLSLLTGKADSVRPAYGNFLLSENSVKKRLPLRCSHPPFADKLGEFLAQPDIARAAGEKARRLYMSKSGAVGKAMEVMEKYVHKS
jgi:hypothetical protein